VDGAGAGADGAAAAGIAGVTTVVLGGVLVAAV
jgi:hypothetical protein